ncbi:78-didemethyl-8-hydroxy-5-deazariboflavin synthase subunit 1 [Patulibacter medicamentivorans]|uniref:FO synthase n=1 Tax=Patulibacter medicamentivorans TaxID=1097667 RepID=H0E4K4_9ACTN|nr:5-amino-6-(D-ribitylamino)uracil--L-tyrosine 4-hydroxyphenyl transferase CofH [Patulibacter medicamentivorans]EHN11375.1 78-didemethyl-8-hydroxy-5-deazariboflavin synthase subunit 1 [Patulibacter medicamentivorans]
MSRRVTFSRNHTLSLSRTCSSVCKYCAFATRKFHLHDRSEVEAILDEAVKRRAKELLILTGEEPDSHPEVMAQLNAWGFEDFVAYVVWAGERALERGLLPHTNLGAVSKDDLARLRHVTASQGVMLESISERLMDTVHAGSPSKHPARRLATIEAAGELRIPFTSGILVGIGETPEERIQSLEALAEVHARHGHLQEVILQNFVPHERYYGRDVGAIADQAARDYWRTGIAQDGGGWEGSPHLDLPDWACPVTVEDMEVLVRATRELMPDVGIQIPPNLADWWPRLVAAGATDLGGLSANGDHISPEHPFPSPNQVRDQLKPQGVALSERLCVYGKYIDEQWIDRAVLDTITVKYWTFIPRGTSGRGEAPFVIDRDLVAPAVAKARDGVALSEQELTALFVEQDPVAVEEIRSAADELRGELAGDTVTFVVNRNINISNVCTVGCAFCGFGQSKRSPDAYDIDEAEFARRVAEAVDYGASELCIQSGIHPDWTLEDYLTWLRRAKAAGRSHGVDLHLHAYSPMEIDHMATISGLPLSELFAQLRDAGLGSTPGTAAEVLDDGVRQRISPNKLPAQRWVEVIEAAHRAGVRSTSTVMFGHIEEPWELARHMRVVRGVQERTGGITEFVPLSFIPFQTRLGRTHGVQEISAEDNLRHTAVFRLALGRTVPNLQASWVKMGLDAATESLRWGVNDLGGTLMEENISRLAGSHHGVRLDPPELIAAAHAAGRPAAERSTLYTILREHPLPLREAA